MTPTVAVALCEQLGSKDGYSDLKKIAAKFGWVQKYGSSVEDLLHNLLAELLTNSRTLEKSLKSVVGKALRYHASNIVRASEIRRNKLEEYRCTTDTANVPIFPRLEAKDMIVSVLSRLNGVERQAAQEWLENRGSNPTDWGEARRKAWFRARKKMNALLSTCAERN